MSKQTIEIYADEEIKQRVELAAAKHNVPVNEYLLTAIEQRLAGDELLEAEQIEDRAGQDSGGYLVRIEELRKQILERRGGVPIDVTTMLDQLRDERDEENLNYMAELRALQEQIRAERNGVPIDVEAILDQLREERDAQHLGLH